MLGLLLVFLLLLAGLAVVFYVGTLFSQAYFYSQPVPALYWRAPLAALVLTLFFAFWCFLAYKSPGRFNSIFEFSASERQEFKKLWSIKKGKEIPYVARTTGQGRSEYRDADGKPWTRSDVEGVVEAIIVEDADNQKIRFEAELTPDKKFKAKQGESVRYVEVGGRKRVMTDDYLGKIEITRWGYVIANLLLNFLHLVAWFLVLWLVLRFQWSHAFGLALLLVAVFTFVVPVLIRRTEDVAKERAAQSTSQATLMASGAG